VWPSNITPPSPFNRYHSISSTYSPEDPENHLLDLWYENSAAGKAGVNAKEDWFLTRVTAPDISLKNL
jgi:hypothetical protein